MASETVRRTLAKAGGWFWLPCPVCGEYMAGFEWRDVHGHDSSIPDLDQPGTSHGICQGCTAKGIGCYAQARLKDRYCLYGHDCAEYRRGLRDRGETGQLVPMLKETP